MTDPVRRKQIEQRIIANSARIMSISDGHQPNDDEVEAYFDAWYDLVRYYQECEDSLVDIEIVRDYADLVHLLNQIIFDTSLDDQSRDRAEMILEELEGQMSEIVKEAVTNKYN